jgi:hypothetical protein
LYRLRRVSFYLFFTLLVALCFGGTARAAEVTVPLDRDGDHLYVIVTINGKKARMVLDTGASVCMIHEDALERLGLRRAGEAVTARGLAGDVSIYLVDLKKISVGGREIPLDVCATLPSSFPLDAEGILGFDFFWPYIVTLDYEKKQMTLRDSDPAYRPAGSTAVPLRFEGRTPDVELLIDGLLCWVTLDVGAGSGVNLTTAFVEKNNLRTRYRNRKTVPVGMGVGGYLFADVARAGVLRLGAAEVRGPIMELSRQKKGTAAEDTVDGLIGGEILSRFRVTLDYQRRIMYLEKGADYDRPFTYVTTGAFPDVVGGQLTILYVLPGSSAAEVGVKAGDVVLEIDGSAFKAPDTKSWTDAKGDGGKEAKPGETKRLRLRSADGTTREVTITRRAIPL